MKRSDEAGEPLDACLVKDVPDMGADRVLGHPEFVRRFARRPSSHEQRRDGSFARREAIEAGEQVCVGFRRPLVGRQRDIVSFCGCDPKGEAALRVGETTSASGRRQEGRGTCITPLLQMNVNPSTAAAAGLQNEPHKPGAVVAIRGMQCAIADQKAVRLGDNGASGRVRLCNAAKCVGDNNRGQRTVTHFDERLGAHLHFPVPQRDAQGAIEMRRETAQAPKLALAEGTLLPRAQKYPSAPTPPRRDAH